MTPRDCNPVVTSRMPTDDKNGSAPKPSYVHWSDQVVGASKSCLPNFDPLWQLGPEVLRQAREQSVCLCRDIPPRVPCHTRT